jgi:hypothetical protein
MRENESDSDGAWQQPREYTSPRAPHDAGDADPASGASWEGTSAAPPPKTGDQDTIAFGSPDSEAGSYHESSAGYGDYPDQPWYSARRDEAGDEDQGGYGSYRDPGYGRYEDRSGYRQAGTAKAGTAKAGTTRADTARADTGRLTGGFPVRRHGALGAARTSSSTSPLPRWRLGSAQG